MALDGGAFYPKVPPPPPGFRLFHPDDLHLTVAFLGAIEPARAHRAFEALEVVSGPDLRIEGLRPFGPPRHYSALALTFAAAEPWIGRLTPRRAQALAAAELPVDPRPFLPHATLARPPRHAEAKDRALGLRWAEEVQATLVGLPATPLGLGLYTWSEARGRDPAGRQFQIVAKSISAGAGAP